MSSPVCWIAFINSFGSFLFAEHLISPSSCFFANSPLLTEGKLFSMKRSFGEHSCDTICDTCHCPCKEQRQIDLVTDKRCICELSSLIWKIHIACELVWTVFWNKSTGALRQRITLVRIAILTSQSSLPWINYAVKVLKTGWLKTVQCVLCWWACFDFEVSALGTFIETS